MSEQSPATVAVGESQVEMRVVDLLRRAYAGRSLALFVGAGLSIPRGIPSWQDLISRFLFPDPKLAPTLGPLLQKSPRWPDRIEDMKPGVFHVRSAALARWLKEEYGFNPTVLARLVEEQEMSKPLGVQGFMQEVRSRLYETYDDKPTQDTLDAVCGLISRSHVTSAIPEIISFNYDDLLENNLHNLSVPAHAVFDAAQPDQTGLRIVHVHGFLPRTGEIPAQSLVLSEQDFHELSYKTFDWRVSRIDHHLRTNTVLFVGLSMSDPGLRRLLDATFLQPKGTRHYLLRLNYALPKDPDGQARLGAELERRLGINPYGAMTFTRGSADTREEFIALTFKAVGAIANEIARVSDAAKFGNILRMARDYETRLFRGMGVETIWLERFDDIPPLLALIR